MRRGDGHADLSLCVPGGRRFRAALNELHVVTDEINRSRWALETKSSAASCKTSRPDPILTVCSNPEFLREGAAIQRFNPSGPRSWSASMTNMRAKSMERLYGRFACASAAPFRQAAASAELIKYAANAFLATQDHLHQRSRRSLRRRRRRCSRSSARHSARQPHRRRNSFMPGLAMAGHVFPRIDSPC